jgi:hypothetical protein
MKILAIEREIQGHTKEDFEPHLTAEALEVWRLYQKDIIRETYFDNENNTAVLILECNNPKEAGEILDTLPLVKANLIKFEIIPLIPYRGFSRLFK